MTDWNNIAGDAAGKTDKELAVGIEKLLSADIGKLFPAPADAAKVRQLIQAIRVKTAYNERVAAFKAISATLGGDLLAVVKKAMFCLALMLLTGLGQAHAGKFSLLDPAAPQTSAGTFISMDGSGSAAGVALAAVIYKAPASNNVFSALGNGWVPVTAGGTIGAGLGGPSIAIGTGLNLVPAARAGLLGAIGALAKPGALASLQAALQAQDSPLALFMGPQYNLVFTSPSRCFGKPTWFIGASVTWR